MFNKTIAGRRRTLLLKTKSVVESEIQRFQWECLWKLKKSHPLKQTTWIHQWCSLKCLLLNYDDRRLWGERVPRHLIAVDPKSALPLVCIRTTVVHVFAEVESRWHEVHGWFNSFHFQFHSLLFSVGTWRSFIRINPKGEIENTFNNAKTHLFVLSPTQAAELCCVRLVSRKPLFFFCQRSWNTLITISSPCYTMRTNSSIRLPAASVIFWSKGGSARGGVTLEIQGWRQSESVVESRTSTDGKSSTLHRNTTRGCLKLFCEHWLQCWCTVIGIDVVRRCSACQMPRR